MNPHEFFPSALRYLILPLRSINAMEILTSTVILSVLISLGIFIRLVIKTLNEHD